MTLAPLLEHRLREFITEHKKSGLILLETPVRLLQRLGAEPFDLLLQVKTDTASRVNHRQKGYDLVIANTGSKEDLKEQAEYAARFLAGSRRRATQEFVQQMQKAGIGRCPTRKKPGLTD